MARSSRIAHVLDYLWQQELKEHDPWVRDDLRISWITVLNASRGHLQPFVDATYCVLGLHPSKVYSAILARQRALLRQMEGAQLSLPLVCLPPKKPPASIRTKTPGFSIKSLPVAIRSD